ncbi:phospholipase A [Marinospirillum alkaliphilum]|uniref:Phospholipase A1 n=1 Tax=Marinospirillum alkaliphilum DSM 21637 TaxID=1122209 RepID=A0A1K1Y0Z1_9GAMM|nr:phospholipase A [Marinospirillum alkaliphilum]SFX55689.1 Phospholipase A1 [Marinospirillum alkaliphilum DSM 21637]
MKKHAHLLLALHAFTVLASTAQATGDALPAAVTLPSHIDRQQASVLDTFNSDEVPALSVFEPMYLIAGGEYGEDIKAQFQFSFKYRIFDLQSPMVAGRPWLENFYLSYTQTSLWNWSADSLPFEDTSYKPSFFWALTDTAFTDLVAFGYAHESNGQDAELSRSTDALFLQPAWSWTLADRELVAFPRLLLYLRKGLENPDITDYRGYGELNLRYGSEDGWVMHSQYRYGKAGHHSLQLDFTYPIRTPIALRTGGFLFIRYFHGYGESLLTYDEKTGPILRIGLAIVR